MRQDEQPRPVEQKQDKHYFLAFEHKKPFIIYNIAVADSYNKNTLAVGKIDLSARAVNRII